MAQPSYTDTRTVDFPDGARIETTTVYYPPPSAPPVLDLGPRLAGVHATSAPAGVKAAFPGIRLTRPFINGVQQGPKSLITKAETACRASWDAGLLPTYSLKLDHDEVMAGRWDPFIGELAEWHTGQPAAELILQHEPENDPAMQGGKFPPYFNHIAARFRAVNTAVPLLYAAMGYQWLPGPVNGTIKGFTSRPADWQGVDCDRHMIDVYSGSSVPLATILPEHKGFQRWMEHVVGDRPYGVAERAFITATFYRARADTIQREKTWVVSDPVGRRCRRYLYFNSPGTENNPAIVLDTAYGEPAVRDLLAAFGS